MSVVIEKKDRHGKVTVTRSVSDRWVNDNADWMRDHGFTVKEGDQEPAKVAQAPEPELVEVPETETVTEQQEKADTEEAPQETKAKRKSKKDDE